MPQGDPTRPAVVPHLDMAVARSGPRGSLPALAGMIASAVVPVAGTSVIDADTAPLTVTVPLPLALSLFDAR